MKADQLREDEKTEDVVNELLADCDDAMHVDCASLRVPFIVVGWFVFPKGTLMAAPIKHGA